MIKCPFLGDILDNGKRHARPQGLVDRADDGLALFR